MTQPAEAATAAEVPRPATDVHWVSPVDRSGELKDGYTVEATRRGDCWTTSFVNDELYRCMQRNFIQDPCWLEAGRSPRTVVCPGLPWSHAVLRLRLTDRLPQTSSGRRPAWGLRLADGRRCLFAQGATGTVHGHHISYICRGRWVLLGNPRRGHVWHIRTAKRERGEYEPKGFRPLTDAWLAVRPDGA